MFDTSVFCQLFLSRLIYSSGGTKFGIFREHVGYWHFELLRGCLINCCKLRCFLSRKLNEVQCQFINSRCIYCYCFVYILYRLLNKQLRQLPRKRSLSENIEAIILVSINNAFVNRSTVVYLRCVILLGTNIMRCLSGWK